MDPSRLLNDWATADGIHATQILLPRDWYRAAPDRVEATQFLPAWDRDRSTADGVEVVHQTLVRARKGGTAGKAAARTSAE
jgi:hypothetical protein